MLGTVMAISFLAQHISAKFATYPKLSGVKEKPEIVTKLKGTEEKSSDIETGSEGKKKEISFSCHPWTSTSFPNTI